MDTGNTGFIMICAALVFIMTPGLAFFYGGLVRRKNVVNTMMACAAIMGLSIFMWTLFGYSLAFGTDHGGVIGSLEWLGLNGVGWDAANPTLPRIDVDKTDNYQASAGLSYSGNKWNLSFGATWSRSDRDESWGTQSDSYGLSIGAGYKLSRTLSANLSGSMSISDPEDGDTSTSYTLMGGFTKTLSDRLSLTAMAGLSFQDYNGYEDDTSVDPSYTLSLSYKASRRIALALSMHSAYESEYYNDGYYNARTTYVWSHNLTGSMTVQWSDKLYSTLSVSGFYEEHVATVSGLGDRDRKYVQLAFNTSYRFNSYVSMYGSVSWKNDQYDYDSGDDSADDIRLDVGMTFTL